MFFALVVDVVVVVAAAACDDDVPFAVPFDDVSLDLPLGSFHWPFDDDFACDSERASLG